MNHYQAIAEGCDIAKNWHSMSLEEVLSALRAGPEGLSEKDAKARLEEYGRNLVEGRGRNPLKLFLRQFTNFLILLLLSAAAIAGLLGEVIDAEAIFFTVLLMGVAGFVQEFRAERAIEALKRMTAPRAKVVRGGRIKEVDASELVPGDIVIVSPGDRVPADMRLIEASDLQVDESPLTGESMPVEKEADVALPKETPLPSRTNMLFMGTYVVKGEGVGVVVATGLSTEMGKIAKSLRSIKERRSLLEEDLDRLGRKLGAVVLGVSAVVFIASVTLEKMSLIDSLILSVALAVAAVPESLPAVATTILALGAYRMAKRNAVVRELGAIEALGACDVVASDKTGTITKGEMTIRKFWIAGVEGEVTGVGYAPEGEIALKGDLKKEILETLSDYIITHVGKDARLIREDGGWKVKGSPTEGSALVFAYKVVGVGRNPEYLTVKVYPFDRFRKRKTTVHKYLDRYLVISSGAPEYLLMISSKVMINDRVLDLDDDLKASILNKMEEFASRGFRTYAIAYKELPGNVTLPSSPESLERDLTFIALFGIIDPPREGVKEALEMLRKAGVRAVMITGDHRLTAEAIGRMIGLLREGDVILEGADLDRMSDDELLNAIDRAVIYARVTPEHKRRIVHLLKSKGHIVAMTGDGVNDAPALKEADIGIAMGIRGTDVAKEVSKLVLKDDNFVTIVEAVREGRVIYENLKKPVNYLLPANIGEVTTILFAQLAELPVPLNAPQLLWVNITTDSLPALALSAEPPEPGLMERPPRGKSSTFITNRKLAYFTLLGTLIGLVNLGLFIPALDNIGLYGARTLVFAAIAFSEFGRALASRSEELHFWWSPFNRWLLPALALSAAIQLLAIYLPFLSTLFDTVPLNPIYILLSLLTAVPVILVDEIRKSLHIKL